MGVADGIEVRPDVVQATLANATAGGKAFADAYLAIQKLGPSVAANLDGKAGNAYQDMMNVLQGIAGNVTETVNQIIKACGNQANDHLEIDGQGGNALSSV